MKKIYKMTMLLMVLGLVSFLSMNSAFSNCGPSVIFKNQDYGLYGSYYDYVTGDVESAYEMDVTMFSKYWAHGTGDTATGSGNDNGTLIMSDFMNDADTYPYWMKIDGDWKNLGNDGCILDDTENGPQIIVFDDRSSDNSTAFYAVACKAYETSIPNYNYDNSVFDHGTCTLTDRYDAGGGLGIFLTALPEVTITNALPNGPPRTGVTVYLSWDANDECGFHSDGDDSCTWENALDSYQVYYRQGTSAPSGAGARNASNWTAVVDADGTLDNEQAQVFIPDPAGAGESSWLAIGFNYDSGFKSYYVGPNSTQVAGPTAAGEFAGAPVVTYLRGNKFKIDWATNAEWNVSEFNVYRSISPTEGFDVPIATVAATGTGSAGANYSYIDQITGIKGIFTYYYQIGMVVSGAEPRIERSEIIGCSMPKGPKSGR